MKSKIFAIGLIVIAVLGISAIAVTVMVYTPDHQKLSQEQVRLPINTTQNYHKNFNLVSPSASTSANQGTHPVITPNIVATSTAPKFVFSSVKSTEPITLYVNWEKPTLLKNLDLFAKDQYTYPETEKYYKVGTIKGRLYDKCDVILANITRSDEMEDYTPKEYFISCDGVFRLTLSSPPSYYGDHYPSFFNTNKFIVDNASESFPELALPLTITDGKSIFKLQEFHDRSTTPSFDEDSRNWKLAFTYNGSINIYTDIQNSEFYMRAPDGTTGYYRPVIDFSNDNAIFGGYKTTDFVPRLTWSNGATSTAIYTGYLNHGIFKGGCGGYISTSTATSIGPSDLIYAGATVNKDPIYEIKDKSHPLLTKTYDAYVNSTYGWNEERTNKNPVSYDEFISMHPVFFWKDPFGHFLQFINIQFKEFDGCEKGKPVIYLYPQGTEHVAVRVAPEGGISKSDPEYKNGWNVVAQPNGQLSDVATGKTYPYLFWESPGWPYSAPKQGFVVEEKDIEQFLTEKLIKLGLNQHELNDFVEFWLPRLKDSPYFFIAFLGNAVMDKIAPLTVNPKPNSIIRVFMYYEPLQAPIPVNEPEILTPKRTGFTVVEWGGVLR